MSIERDETPTLTTEPPPLLAARQRHADAAQAELEAQTAFQDAKARRAALASRLQSVQYQLRMVTKDQDAETLAREARDLQALLATVDEQLTACHVRRAGLSKTVLLCEHSLRALGEEASRVWHAMRACQRLAVQAPTPAERLEAREDAAQALDALEALLGADEARALQAGTRPAWLIR